MITKNKLFKLNKSLKKGDQKAIAELSGISSATVNRFLNGKDDCVSDETASLIILNASEIIKKRNKLKSANEKIINSIQL